ncbi:conserved hypothetical protein [Frankia sp. Hr75.2]|nr:conserved hypothetical protein [Frankia sp. Hr75.2]
MLSETPAFDADAHPAMAELLRLADETARPDVLRQCPVLLGLLRPPLVSTGAPPDVRARVFRGVLQAVMAEEQRRPTHPENYILAAAELLALHDPRVTNLEARRLAAGAVLRKPITTERRVRPHLGPMSNALLHAILDFLDNEARVRDLAKRLPPSAREAPPGAEADNETGGADDEQDDVAALRRLQQLSVQMADELDIASSSDGTRTEHRLSTDLYVRRTQEADVLAALAPDGSPSATVVSGEAGHGKSSLLWGVWQRLQDDERVESFLLNAIWLIDPNGTGREPLLPAGDLAEAVRTVAARGRTCVVLIDTADLLLHYETDRRRLLDICDRVMDDGAHVVVTSRPEEARALPRTIFQHVGLQPYDARELPEAVERHVRAYCPDAPPHPAEEKIALILRAVSRGLPTREICQSPLLLRLLFDLYAPEFPPLELDVSGLYRMYWQRRVVADTRSEVGLSGTATVNLSGPAESVGLALLATGRTELASDVLLRYMRTVADQWNGGATSAPLGEAIDTLTRRGVLLRSRVGLRFLHQTLFEYAAALGLLERDGLSAVEFLDAHLRQHPDDLFVGAVFEQLLILAAADPLMTDHVQRTLTGLADSGSVALQRTALGVVAYRPELTSAAEYLIRAVEPAAARRYAQIAPSVADVDTVHLLTALARAWERSVHCRMTVMEAFERLATREPAAVLGTVRQLRCDEYVRGMPKDSAPVIQLFARVVCAVAPADELWAAGQLMDLLELLVSRATSRDLPLYILELIASHWPTVGSAAFAAEIQAFVVQSQEVRDSGRAAMREALGRILALSWRDRPVTDDAGWWHDLLDEVCTALEAKDQDVLANARLAAMIEYLSADWSDSRLTEMTAERLLQLKGPSAPFALAREAALPRFLSIDSPAAQPALELIVRRLNGLPAPGNKPTPGSQVWASVVRKSLHAVRSSEQIAWLLTMTDKSQDVDLWLAEDGLALLLVQAAIGGHDTARAALMALHEQPSVTSGVVQKIVSYDIAKWLDRDRSMLSLLIELSHARRTARPLGDVVREHGELLREQLASHTVELQRLISRLLGGSSGQQQQEGAHLWLLLDQLEVVPPPVYEEVVRWIKRVVAPQAIANLYRLAGQAAIAGRLPTVQAEGLLRGRFALVEKPPRLVRPGREKPDVVAEFARVAWLELLCIAWPLAHVDRDIALDIAVATPTDTGVLGTIGHLIGRLAESGRPSEAADLLVAVAGRSVSLGLSAKAESDLANKLRRSMRMIFRYADVGTATELLRAAPHLPRATSRLLVAAAAQESFERLRDVLLGLLDQELPAGVKQQIDDDMRARARTASTGKLPEVLTGLQR